MRRKLARRSILPIVLFTLVGAGIAAGQSAPNRPSWGTSDKIFHPVSPSEFAPTDSSTVYFRTLGSGLASPDTAFFTATVRLPQGALLTDLELDYIDTSSLKVDLLLYGCQALHTGCTLLANLESNDGPQTRSFVVADLTPLNYTVDNSSKWLLLVALTDGLDTALLGAYVVYKLQVSPAPAVATFADVPTTHPFFRFVEALVDAGITAGCGGGNYCVDNPITRGEMAVFLAVALGLHFPG